MLQLMKEPALEPSLGVRIVIGNNMSNPHQNPPEIAKNGIKRTAGVVRCRVPIATDKGRQLWRQRLEMVKELPHLEMAMALRRMGIEVKRYRSKRAARMFHIGNDGPLAANPFLGAAHFVLT